MSSHRPSIPRSFQSTGQGSSSGGLLLIGSAARGQGDLEVARAAGSRSRSAPQNVLPLGGDIRLMVRFAPKDGAPPTEVVESGDPA